MDDKKRTITLSAIDVFQEKGIEKATVSDIVKGAGIAQGTFYLYFPSKLSIMPAIAEILIEKTLAHFHSVFKEDVTFQDQLKQIIDIIFQYTKEYHDLFAILYVGMGSNKQLNQWESIYEPYYNLISGVLKKAQTNQALNANLDPKRTAIMLIGFIEAAADQSYLYDRENAETTQDKKQDVMQLLLYGIAPTT